jgi:hypothetical protein
MCCQGLIGAVRRANGNVVVHDTSVFRRERARVALTSDEPRADLSMDRTPTFEGRKKPKDKINRLASRHLNVHPGEL